MNLPNNQQIVNDLKRILDYYDYLEYDESHSKTTGMLCIRVSNTDTNCSLEVIQKICAQLGSGYTCEPEKPTKFYIRMLSPVDLQEAASKLPFAEETLRSELNSASAYYSRAIRMYDIGMYEFAIEDYQKAFRLGFSDRLMKVIAMMNLHAAKEAQQKSDRERFYWEYHNKFLEREAKRNEVRKRHGTPEWQAKRAEVLERDGRLCVCGDIATEMHHKTYENLGQELPSDLVALCMYCYKGIHSGEKIKRFKGSNPMNSKEYRKEYLESRHWKEIRKKVLERDNYLCICGERATYAHHKTYENLWQEKLSDLVALCKNCHDGFHGRLYVSSEHFWCIP